MSQHARDTVNPIRRIVDVMSVEPNAHKTLIRLHLGDPTVTGTMNPPQSAIVAIQNSLLSGRYNGYGPATGIVEVCYSQFTVSVSLTTDDRLLQLALSYNLGETSTSRIHNNR